MPGAACVLGFGLMFGQGVFRKHPGTQVVINTNQTMGLKSTEPIDFKPQPTDTKVAVNKALDTSKVDIKHMVAKIEPEEVNARILATVPGNEDAYDPDLGKMPPMPTATSGAMVASIVPTQGKSSKSTDSIIEIYQDTDQQTGACKATEVSSSSNVPVRG